MTVRYDPSRRKWPDANEYYPVEDWGKLNAALRGPGGLQEAPFGFKVGNGDLQDPESDPYWDDHRNGADRNGLVSVGYWWGPAQMDKYLTMYPPKDGRIPALDFEGSHVNDVGWFARSAELLHREWGRWPLFYGGAGWRAHQKPGTALENCFHWVPGYNGEFDPGIGVGPYVAHQFAASCRGPQPQSFPGVNPCCDMNTLLVPFGTVKTMAGLGDDMALDREKDKAAFAAMFKDATGFGLGDAGFWLRGVAGGGDVLRGDTDSKRLPEPFTTWFEFFTAAQNFLAGGQGGDLAPALQRFIEQFEPKG
jgi:hypothetical protein